MDIKEHELEFLTKHLGHTMGTHRKYYRLPSNALEVAKVGKLLLALEAGVDKYAGMSLDDISLDSDIE